MPGRGSSKGVPLEFFNKCVYLVEFLRNVDALGTVRRALVASYAVVCLPQLRNSSVITDEKCAACLPVVLALGGSRDVALVETFVVMQQHSRNVYPPRTWHAVLAVVARYCVILHHESGRVLQK